MKKMMTNCLDAADGNSEITGSYAEKNMTKAPILTINSLDVCTTKPKKADAAKRVCC